MPPEAWLPGAFSYYRYFLNTFLNFSDISIIQSNCAFHALRLSIDLSCQHNAACFLFWKFPPVKRNAQFLLNGILFFK